MAITIASQYTQKYYNWTAWKSIQALKNGNHQYDDDGIIYTIYFYDGPEVHLCQIWKSNIPESVINNGGQSQEQNDADKTEFETKYKPHSNKQIVIKTNDGRTINAIGKGDISKSNFYTHDWSDPTTWYENSIRLVDEIASDDGYQITYSLSHNNIIDLYHGKITQEDFMKDKDGYSYRVSIKVNNTLKTEQNPHFGTGGDFTIDYNLGKITFSSALDPSDVVKATYHYATNSIFTVKPSPGKMLRVDLAEVQFASNIQVTDTIIFQPYGFVDAFAPQYLQSNGGPYPSGTKIPLGNPVVYKSMTDYQAEAMKAYPVYPAIGGDSWRGCPYSILIMNWDYISSTVLKSSLGMELRIRLEHDVPFEGWYATATFYCNAIDE